ncbi:MAG: hypothetical protein MUO40_08090 [Anaerolineaceae bacterium]|nr:hypothetical protein [Anaerolineaceae bacterium]
MSKLRSRFGCLLMILSLLTIAIIVVFNLFNPSTIKLVIIGVLIFVLGFALWRRNPVKSEKAKRNSPLDKISKNRSGRFENYDDE